MPILFATVLIDLIGFGIIIPILPFLAPKLGAGTFEIAVIFAAYSVAGALVGPAWGRLSDRIGRKPVLLICLAGASAAHLMLAHADSLAMLYASRVLAGLMSGNFGVASAIVADITPPQGRAKAMGAIGAAFGLGMVAGPFLGGVLAGDGGDFARAALCAAGLSATAMAAGLLFLRESLPATQRAEHASRIAEHGNGGSLLNMLRSSGNTLLTAQYFLNNSCHTAVSYLFPLWVGAMLGWGAKEVGMVFGAQGIAMSILQAGLIGVLVRKLGELRLLLLGTTLMATGFTVAAIASGSVAILVGFFCAITGGSMCTPVLNTLVANRTPAHLRGRMLGTTSSSSALGRVFGPLIAGVLLALFGYHLAWLCGTVLALLMASWALTRLRQDGASFAAPMIVAPAGEKAHAG